jgi:phosphohistidine phosphatase
MRLLIVRHAIAVPHGTPGIADDERPLTPEGEKKFRRAAEGLARICGTPDVILTSPLPRARRTAEIAAELLEAKAPEDEPALADGDVEALDAALARRPEARLVAVFGHEPHVSSLLAHLLGTRREERLAFRKGGAALVELDDGLAHGGTLLWCVPPRVLRRLAG